MTGYKYPDSFETGRLFIRKLVQDDHKEWSRFFEDKEATRFLPDFNLPTPELRARHWIEKQHYRYENNTFGLLALIHKESQKMTGMCGLLLQDVNGVKELEIGYHLIREYWGNGYAIEAASMFKQHAFRNRLAPSVTSIININNFRSQKVAISNGMTREKTISWNGGQSYIYRVPTP